MIKHNISLLENAISLYKERGEIKDVALSTGKSYQYIYILLKNCGVYKSKYALYKTATDKYIKLYKRSWYISDIGKECGKDRATIIYHLKKANVFRPGSRSIVGRKIRQVKLKEVSPPPPVKNFIYKKIVEKQKRIDQEKNCLRHIPILSGCFKCGYSEPV